MSVASEVYTQLGLDAVESWTSLCQRYEAIKKEMETMRGPELDRLLKEIQSVGGAINRIEEDAGIPAKNRTS
jgi:hypothetical protein